MQHRKSNGRNFGSARAICNLNCETTFDCLTKNALVFTQSDARNFFMYSIISPTNYLTLSLNDLETNQV